MKKIYMLPMIAWIFTMGIFSSNTFAQAQNLPPVSSSTQINPQMVINDQILNAGWHTPQTNDNTTYKPQYSYHKNWTGGTWWLTQPSVNTKNTKPTDNKTTDKKKTIVTNKNKKTTLKTTVKTKKTK